MDKLIETPTVLFLILLLGIVLLSFPLKCNIKKSNGTTKEDFYVFGSYPQQYCGSCGYLGRVSCNNCANCGYCVTDGVGECVPGDSQGPYFRSDCDYYEYKNPYLYPYIGEFPWHKYWQRWDGVNGSDRWDNRKYIDNWRHHKNVGPRKERSKFEVIKHEPYIKPKK